MIDIKNLIINPKGKFEEEHLTMVPNAVDKSVSFRYYSHNIIEDVEQETYNSCSYRNNKMYFAFSNNPSDKSAEYYYPGHLMQFATIRNSFHQGVVYATIRDNNYLVTSDKLSGCMVCSIYFPSEQELYFYHVGADNNNPENAIGSKYLPEYKNTDLLNAIYLSMNREYTIEDKVVLSDIRFSNMLLDFLNSLNKRVIVHIYIGVIDEHPQHDFDTDHLSIKRRNVIMELRYYRTLSYFMVSGYNILHSVFFASLNDKNKYKMIKRYNYFDKL